MRSGFCFAFTVLLLTSSALAEGEAKNVGKKIDFQLVGLHGKTQALHDLKDRDAVVIVFLSFDCPVATSYAVTLEALAKTYAERKVAFLGVFATSDNAAELAEQARDFKLSFPLFRDDKYVAVKALQAQKVPEAFVLDRDFVLRYRGRINDGYVERLKPKDVTRHDLKTALDEVLAGKRVTHSVTEAVGCPIQIKKATTVSTKFTYYRDVLPILQNRCQSCHRPGEVGPFSLATYKQALTWADDIKEYTQSKKMPPWKPVEGLDFVGARKMTAEEITTLAAWVDGGTPEGDPKDAPKPIQFTDGWQLGKPDLILTSKEDTIVGANGDDLFRCYVFSTNLPEDKFVVAYEVRPGNPRVLHHTVHFLDIQGRGRQLEKREADRPKASDEKDRGPGYNARMGPGFFPPSGDVGGWAPGMRPVPLSDGVGFYLPKGADIVVQHHYHRSGKEEKDRTQIGFYFAKKPTSVSIQPLVIPGLFFGIPSGEANYSVKGTIYSAQDCTIHAVTPHMHLLGKTIKLTATTPDNKTITLLNITDWDFNWQETYFLKTPMKIKAGTKLSLEATFDNSDKNPANPNKPPKVVRFGEQTTNEMCFGFLAVTTDDDSLAGFRLSPQGQVIKVPRLTSKK